jgi:hypothetical protein
LNLSVELINAVLGYLGNKPYAEVVHLINAIQSEAAKSSSTEEPENAISE